MRSRVSRILLFFSSSCIIEKSLSEFAKLQLSFMILRGKKHTSSDFHQLQQQVVIIECKVDLQPLTSLS